MAWIVENYKYIALIAALGLTLARPLLVAWGVPEATIDELIAFLGNVGVAVIRSILPVASRGYTYTCAGGGAAVAAAGVVGLLSAPVALTVSSIAFAATALTFHRATMQLRREAYNKGL